MRRLPIYFLINISESMVGEQIQQVEEGMAAIIKAVKTDPYAIERVPKYYAQLHFVTL